MYLTFGPIFFYSLLYKLCWIEFNSVGKNSSKDEPITVSETQIEGIFF